MKTKMDLRTAQKLARSLVEKLRPYCSRIEVAGSTRRKKSVVGDIEIVAMPTSMRPIQFYAEILAAQPVNSGTKYMKFELPNGVQLDLYFVFDAIQWGYIFAQRTGPAEFNKYIFTTPARGGIRPPGLESIDGYIYINGRLQDTSTEEKFFNCFGLAYLGPENRHGFDDTDTPEFHDAMRAVENYDPLSQIIVLFSAIISKRHQEAPLKQLISRALASGKQKLSLAKFGILPTK